MKLTANSRVAILLTDGIKGVHGKTGLAFLRYSPTNVVVVIDPDSAGESLPQLTGIERQVPIVSNTQGALAYAPEALLIGIAPSGGQLPTELRAEIAIAVQAGVSVINGLHTQLKPQFPNLQPQQWIWDLRQEPSGLSIGQGKARSLHAQRILTVGTDMAIGKMSTSLELYYAALDRGIKAQFIATGQAGIAIAGGGIALDAVRVDFAAGAVEQAVLNAAANQELIVIEGQGSLLHPGSTATLPLIRGSQPTGLVLVHRAGATQIRDFPQVKIPPLPEVVKMYETVASSGGAFGQVKVKAIALNTFGLEQEAAQTVIQSTAELTGLPCSDVVRFGGASLLAAIYGK
ncbi:MAG: DUF1611 domain-containing protein [Cyanobacteria bacterium P01_A01_bin.40]